jgi:hypothetical protein
LIIVNAFLNPKNKISHLIVAVHWIERHDDHHLARRNSGFGAEHYVSNNRSSSALRPFAVLCFWAIKFHAVRTVTGPVNRRKTPCFFRTE